MSLEEFEQTNPSISIIEASTFPEDDDLLGTLLTQIRPDLVTKIETEFGMPAINYLKEIKKLPSDEVICLSQDSQGWINAILTGRLLRYDSPQQIGFSIGDDLPPKHYFETQSIFILRNAVASTKDSPGIANLIKALIDHFLEQGQSIDHIALETLKSFRGGKVHRVYKKLLQRLEKEGIISELLIEEQEDIDKTCFIFRYTDYLYKFISQHPSVTSSTSF